MAGERTQVRSHAVPHARAAHARNASSAQRPASSSGLSVYADVVTAATARAVVEWGRSGERVRSRDAVVVSVGAAGFAVVVIAAPPGVGPTPRRTARRPARA